MSKLWEALGMLVFGMGGVMVFLTLLVFLMQQSAKFFVKYAHLLPDLDPKSAPQKSVSSSDDEQIAVAVAAIKAKL